MVLQKNSLPLGPYRKFSCEPRSVSFVSMRFEDQEFLLSHQIIFLLIDGY